MLSFRRISRDCKGLDLEEMGLPAVKTYDSTSGSWRDIGRDRFAWSDSCRFKNDIVTPPLFDDAEQCMKTVSTALLLVETFRTLW